MNKQKQIEEMAKIASVTCSNCCTCCDFRNSYNHEISCTDYFVANEFYNAEYRNCKDKVVLSKEKYEQLCKDKNDYKQRYDSVSKRYEKLVQSSCEELEKQRTQAYKQAVKYVLEKISNTPIKLSYGLDAKTVNIMTATLKEKIDELAKEFGVEAEE